MGRRRRRSIDQSPVGRIRMWDVKMRGDVIGEVIDNVKPLARERVVEYQVQFSNLLNIVRRVLERYPSEYGKTQQYVSFAERLWYVLQRHGGEAVNKHANAVFNYFGMLGLNKDAMTDIAKMLGIAIADPYTFLNQFGFVDVQHTRHEITIPAYEPIDTSYSIDIEPESTDNYVMLLRVWYQTVAGVSVKLVLYKRSGEVVELTATDLTGEWTDLNRYGLLTKASVVFTVTDVLTSDVTVYCEVKAIEVTW